MVAITGSAAGRQQQSQNTNNVVLPAGIKNVCGNSKKKKVAKKRVPSPTKSLLAQTIVATPDDTSLTTPTHMSDTGSSHQQDNHDVDGIVDDGEQRLDLSPVSPNSINNNQEDNLCVLDDNDEFDTLTSWPVVVGEIEWCKTNRGNDRLCMSGYTYDFMSEALKKNQRNFRCSRKNTGCRSIIYIHIDSNGYKGSNIVEHNHQPNYHHTKRLLILQTVKDRVLTEPTSVTRIIEDEYIKNKLNNGDRCHFLLPQAQGKQTLILYEILRRGSS